MQSECRVADSLAPRMVDRRFHFAQLFKDEACFQMMGLWRSLAFHQASMMVNPRFPLAFTVIMTRTPASCAAKASSSVDRRNQYTLPIDMRSPSDTPTQMPIAKTCTSIFTHASLIVGTSLQAWQSPVISRSSVLKALHVSFSGV